MANDTPITVVGNLTADPELKFTPSGHAVANFTVASTPRQFDKQANEFKDGETLFMRCSIWREAAENVAESLTRGARVIVTGRLVSRSWETTEGEKRTVMEMQVDEVGPSLRYAKAQVTKTPKGGNSWGGNQQQDWTPNQQPAQQAQPAQQQAQPAPQQQAQPTQQQMPASGGWGGPANYDEPPF